VPAAAPLSVPSADEKAAASVTAAAAEGGRSADRNVPAGQQQQLLATHATGWAAAASGL
jgi:hypothetical protein